MLVGQQGRDHGNSGPGRPCELKTERQPSQQSDHHDVHGARDHKRPSDAEFFRNGIQPGSLVEVHVLASVEHIEAADPERDRGAKDQHAPVERAANRDPRSRWRNAEAKAENEVRPGSESLGVRIKKQNRQRNGRKFQRERIQLPCGEHQDCGRNQSEHPGETDGEFAFGQSAVRSARIAGVVF